ncbi:hypothetical protein AGMMS49928_13110 [Spirochaetia bacterium]|nr:hypothetical protein AGMMS49928_13110 [Spirochaetia bacterium]
MNASYFDKPFVLVILFALIPFLILDLFHRKNLSQAEFLFARSRSNSSKSSKNKIFGKISFSEFRFRCFAGGLCFYLFLACMIIALAGPRWGGRVTTVYRRGLDLVLALDLSRSMEVRDSGVGAISGASKETSRLERSAAIALDLTKHTGGIRLGAAIGRSRGVLAVPLTYDTEGLSGFLESLRSGTVSGKGTNLEALVDAALGAFQEAFPGRRAIVLFSDGETFTGNLQAAADRVREAGITLCVLGMGTDEGGPVPREDASGFMQDDAGKTITSFRQSDFLREIAVRAGGMYVDGNRPDAASFLAEYLAALSSGTGPGASRREPGSWWYVFVCLGLFFWALSRFMGIKTQAFRGLLGAALILCLSSCARTAGQLLIMEANFFFSRGMYTEAIASYLEAREYDSAAPYAEYGLGSVYFSMDEGGAALERFDAAEKSLAESNPGEETELAYRLRYNRGIVHFEQGDFTRAAESFREALEKDGGRLEAKRNLELSLLALSRERSAAATAASQGSGNSKPEGEKAEALFDYIRMKEQDHWKSREWTEEDTYAGPDY